MCARVSVGGKRAILLEAHPPRLVQAPLLSCLGDSGGDLVGVAGEGDGGELEGEVVGSSVCKKSLKHMGCTPDSPRRDFSTTMCSAGVAPVTFSTMGFLILIVVPGRGVLHVPVPSRSRTACFQQWRRLSGDAV